MASGGLRANGFNYWVVDDSCFAAINAIRSINSETGKGSCSVDPVQAGTYIQFEVAGGEGSGYVVESLTASSVATEDLGAKPADWASTSFLLQALLIVAAVSILFSGYRAGDKL